MKMHNFFKKLDTLNILERNVLRVSMPEMFSKQNDLSLGFETCTVLLKI